MTSRRVTIDDVAAAAGVSRQTVSNVLRGTGRVGAATADRIRGVVDALGYSPHPGASSLRSRRTGQLAYPLASAALEPDNVIVMQFIPSLVKAAGAAGYHVLLTANGPDGIRELVRSGRVDGFVFSDMFGADERLEIVEETRTPYACFGRTPAEMRQAWVDVDNATATRVATEHMVSLGHRDVAYLGFGPTAYWDAERLDGYVRAARDLGIAVRPASSPDNANAAMDAAATALVTATDRPSAIVCSSDALALAVYRAADHAGLTIGVDLAVSGVDSSVIGRSLVPTLTTMRVPVDRIAELIVDRFVDEVADRDADVEGTLVVPELQPGASTVPERG